MPAHIGFKKGGSSNNPDRIKDKNDTHKRDRATINRLEMYKSGKPIRSRDGKIIGGEYMAKDQAGGVKMTASTGRTPPDRRWFGNTKVVGQTALDKFRDALATRMHDPYSVVLRAKTLPTGLLGDAPAATAARSNLLTSESFEHVYGAKKQRKRVKLHGLGEAGSDMSALAAIAASAGAAFEASPTRATAATAASAVAEGTLTEAKHSVFTKGGSKRILGELFKVLDCRCVVSGAGEGGRGRAHTRYPCGTLILVRPPPPPPTPGTRRGRGPRKWKSFCGRRRGTSTSFLC